MLKLATILDNPGEPAVQTRYRDPYELKALGYTGLVIYESTALSGLASTQMVAEGELRRWVVQQSEQITRTMERARAAGLGVWFFYDALVLSEELVQRDADTLSCKGRPGTVCPGSERALERSAAGLQAALQRWPMAEGVVLRFGETDARRMPHLTGNDILSPHCARCSHIGRADRIVGLIERFHELVVGRFNKRLIARAWNVRPGGLHDSLELAERVVPRLPGSAADKRLMLSFKFTQTDFWRYQKWNPSSLACGSRPVVYELQCQREFEGKGGIPNWQGGLWRDGYPETRGQTSVSGLSEVAEQVQLEGVWAWVRGGGWGGPFVSDETWIDANVFAVPRLADQPWADAGKLAREWVRTRLGLRESEVVERLAGVLEASPEVVRQAFYFGPLAGKGNPWHPAADWIQDDLLDVHAAWRIVQRLGEHELDELVHEKEAAAARMGADRAAVQGLMDEAHRKALEPLVNTLMYGESLVETLRDLIAGLVAYRRHQQGGDSAQAELARQKLRAAQSHWNQHVQHHSGLAGCATAFRETGLWELTQGMLDELAELREVGGEG